MKQFEDVPVLVNVACQNLDIENLEDIPICEVGGITCIWIRLLRRDVVVIYHKIILHCRNGGIPVLLSLALVVLVAIAPLDILRLLFVVEYETPDMLTDIGVA